jgi:hypothetical protein
VGTVVSSSLQKGGVTSIQFDEKLDRGRRRERNRSRRRRMVKNGTASD